MRSISASNLRKNLATELDRVAADGEPLIVHRNGDRPAVIVVPLADYKEMDATEYLLSNPENAKVLLEAIRDLEAGKGKPRQLIDD